MNNQELIIRFTNVDEAQATSYARELKDQLENEVEGLEANIKKERVDTQDFGATLVLVLGAPAIVVLAKGIADYLRTRPNAELEVACKEERKIKFSGRSEDAAKIADSLSQLCG